MITDYDLQQFIQELLDEAKTLKKSSSKVVVVDSTHVSTLFCFALMRYLTMHELNERFHVYPNFPKWEDL